MKTNEDKNRDDRKKAIEPFDPEQTPEPPQVMYPDSMFEIEEQKTTATKERPGDKSRPANG